MATNTTPLPSTIDDIIQSDRGTTLSPQELHHISALIGVAKSGNLDDKTTTQKNRVKNNEPLSNRRVMVPVTSKAL